MFETDITSSERIFFRFLFENIKSDCLSIIET